MEILKDGINHHAYLIEGDLELSFKELILALERLEIPTLGNPDILIKDYDNLLIDHAREIKDFQSESTSEFGKKKIIILKTRSFSYPAQNALLKVFEEPRPGVVIFLIMPESTKLYPTLRSRLLGTVGEYAPHDALKKDAKVFLNGTIKVRLDFLKKFLDVESKSMLKEKAINFLNQLEEELSRRDTLADKDKVKDIYLVKKYLGDQGSSPKILLEHLAVVL
jgi:DNA polymerase III delta prime subunit